jgi:zinc transporter, ZIP family
MNFYPIIFTLVTSISTIGGGLFVHRYKGRFGIIMSFAAAVLIAVPLFDLLPQSYNLAVKLNVSVENILYFTALGFLILYAVERYFCVRRICQGEICENIQCNVGGFWGTIVLSIQSYMDGFVIGLSFLVDFHVGLVVAIAIIANDFVDGINAMTLMLSSGNTFRSSLKMLGLDAIAPILGALTTMFVTIPQIFVVFLLALFAGSFLYLGASELLPKACQKNPPLVSVISSLAGFAVIFAITKLLNV